MREDKVGAYYEVPLLDGVPPLVVSGPRAGAYGSSFRFRVTREDSSASASASDYNPDGLPERTIREVELYEFGPVTFPAYAGATAGVRSITDDFYRHVIPTHLPRTTPGPSPTSSRNAATRTPAEPDRSDPHPPRRTP